MACDDPDLMLVLNQAVNFAATVRLENTEEWMLGLVKRLQSVCDAQGTGQQVAYQATDGTIEITQAVPLDVDELIDLIGHMWVHNGHLDCGSHSMTTKQKQLYRRCLDIQSKKVNQGT